MITRPIASEYNEYYKNYVANVHNDAIAAMYENVSAYVKLLSLPDLDLNYKYGPDKWTVRECIVHICDTEKIFNYRALRISRGDETPLPGFEQDSYIAYNDFSHLTIEDLIGMVKTTMNSSISFYSTLKKEDTEKIGTASNSPVSVRALAYISAGHAIHHLNLFRDRYSIEIQ